MGVRFIGSKSSSSDTLLLNIIPSAVDVALPPPTTQTNASSPSNRALPAKPWQFYSGFDVGPASGWVLASKIGSLHSPPWTTNAPVPVHSGGSTKDLSQDEKGSSLRLPPLSLNFM